MGALFPRTFVSPLINDYILNVNAVRAIYECNPL